jgi:D-arabinose 1-dehydrogenase-like Zn-dependent alcohol dehydrogenase
VTALGDGVTNLKTGQRVAVPWLGYACGTCRDCLTGLETLCTRQRNTGYPVAGGLRRALPGRGGVRGAGAGRLVLVALPSSGTLSIPVFDTVLNGTSVNGSIVGTRADLAEVFALQAAGRTG